MKLLIQRVSSSSVNVEEKVVGKISKGLLVFAGLKVSDDIHTLNKLCDKCLNLRIFEDEQSKMNLSVLDITGEILIISQFTLYANCKKGRRPGFDLSMPHSGFVRSRSKPSKTLDPAAIIRPNGVWVSGLKGLL